MPAIKKVGIGLFFTLVEYVCDETQRNPPTRQFFTSCIEILGQVSLFLEYENIFKIWFFDAYSYCSFTAFSEGRGSLTYSEA